MDNELMYLLGSACVALTCIGVVVFQRIHYGSAEAKLKACLANEVEGNIYRTDVIRAFRTKQEEQEKVLKSQAQLVRDKSDTVAALLRDMADIQHAAQTIQERLDGV